MNIGVSTKQIKRYAEYMKHFLSILMIAGIICTGFLGCEANNKAGSSRSPDETIDNEGSYALGVILGSNLKSDNVILNMDEFTRGIKDVLSNSTRYGIDEAQQIFQQAFSALAEERDAENRQAENEFLAENSKKPGIIITGSGLQYEVISEGNGPKPDAYDSVRVHYEGTLIDGSVFDSSYSRGEPIEFPLMGVIPGWTEGLQLMNVGSKYRLYIPSDLGYGPRGAGPQIPPFATLIFEVELLDIIHDH